MTPEKYSEMLVIKMRPSELQALEKVAKALDQPVSSVARQIVMRAVQTPENGVIHTSTGSLVLRKKHPQAKQDEKVSKRDALRLMRAEMKELNNRLDQMELEEVVRER